MIIIISCFLSVGLTGYSLKLGKAQGGDESGTYLLCPMRGAVKVQYGASFPAAPGVILQVN